MTNIQKILFEYQDEKYGDFMSKLVPTEERKSFIGIRSPSYKKIVPLVKALSAKEIESFKNTLPHKYHEENCLHIALINSMKDYDECVSSLEKFIPYVTNWAVSDGLNPKVFEKNKDSLIKKIEVWIKHEHPYAKRIALLMLMKFYLDDDFNKKYLKWAAEIRSEEYYVNMMTAWYFAEALVKQWDEAIVFIQKEKLDVWTHNKAIQKARESYRITDEQKEYLNSLKRKPSKTDKK